MKKLQQTFFVLFVVLSLSLGQLQAAEVKLAADWAWNGTDTTTQGFKFYLDGKMVQDVSDPAARSVDMVLDLANGKHLFSMTAYGPDWETAHSPDYPFEYLHVESAGRPAPMVIIRIN